MRINFWTARKVHPMWNFRLRHAITFGVVAVCFFNNIFGTNKQVMAQEIKESPVGARSFSLSWAGGMEYGSRQISFDGIRKFYFTNGDTLGSETQTGVGVFELDLQNADLAEVKLVGETLCNSDIQKGGPETVDPPAVFSVTCSENGQVVTKNGSIRLIPPALGRQIFPALTRFSDRAYSDGVKVIKLDFSVIGIEKGDGKFIVSVRFINSGNRWVKFKTPDQWPMTTYGGTLGVSPRKNIGGGDAPEWGFPLAGKKILNRNDFHDGSVMLNPGDVCVFKIESTPSDRFVKGEYEFSGAAFMNITYEGDGRGLSNHVDFRPITTRIKFEQDYPSNPQERAQYEKTHRENLSQWPVKPGETFAEDGLYRAAGMSFSGNLRSLQLKAFKAGDTATTEKVAMPTGDGYNLTGPVQWLWEATAPTPVKEWSLDMIADTVQFCEADAECPRSGRWVKRIRSRDGYGQNPAHYDVASLVTLRRGQRMPLARDDMNWVDWEWVGA